MGVRCNPFAFTEQVLAMFSGITLQFCGDINNIIRNLKGYAENPATLFMWVEICVYIDNQTVHNDAQGERAEV